ncbi:MAG: hypothetical protein GOV00_04475 [Candidatus Altiarchaeota archaeon]|nr:hypothetical protein [Candidatus Altiarchaeota archaeon]
MGVQESVDIAFMVMGFLLLYGALVVMGSAIISNMFGASAMYSSSVRAGLLSGCMSVSNMHEGTEINIDWNLLPVDVAVAHNLVVAVTKKVGWIAFPGTIIGMPVLEGLAAESSELFYIGEVEGWIARGSAIENIRIYHNEAGRGVVIG